MDALITISHDDPRLVAIKAELLHGMPQLTGEQINSAATLALMVIVRMSEGHGHKGMKPAKPPMGAGGPATSGAGPVQPGRAGGAIAVKAPKDLKAFGHPAPGLKQLTTDRGAFRIKG